MNESKFIYFGESSLPPASSQHNPLLTHNPTITTTGISTTTSSSRRRRRFVDERQAGKSRGRDAQQQARKQ